MNKNGFTLFEALLSVMVLGSISTGIILKEVENRNQNERLRFIDEAMSIVKAVDHRIAIDGYDPDLWTKLKWDNEEDIVNSLIKEDLTSQYHDKCSGGKWKPATSAENNTKLISCNLWGSRRNFGETIKAELREDSLGFIQGFDLLISFDDEENFKKYFRDIKYSLNQISVNPSQELSGIYINSLVSTSSGVDIGSYECINDPLDCAIKLSLERSGGNEYIRADGSNSMIGEHLTFIESKGQSPLKCLRWSNTQRDGSGVWSKVDDEDCGIGIYEKTGQPVMVDVVADTGTFKNVLLDQNCIYYQWNGSEVVNSGTTKPCGISNDGSEVFQVVPNSYNKNIHTDKLYSNTIHTKSLITETISSDLLEALDRLKTDLIESSTLNAPIEVISDLNIKEILRAESDFYVYNNAYVGGNQIVSGLIQSQGDIISDSRLVSTKELEIKKVNTEGSSCSTNGSISRLSDGSLLSCVSGKWQLPTVKDATPIGTVVLWASLTIPDGWVEMKGQSTASYPELKALIGNTIPDMRGVFVRGLDRGRGLDSGRSLSSYQGDAIRNISGTFGAYLTPTGTHVKTSGAFYGTLSGGSRRPSSTKGNAGYNDTGVFDASRVVPTANENRPKNVALLYIIKAK
ncbi:phage tail protein [Vibrio cincinnatiensis]|uniref:phage tail protein n=1 Tax=Vibrio cincinnatiensis TaxID=675 RepID=UPI001302AFC0|nr:phage tail protein [Vibrio cincinnatiensis]